MAHVAVITLLFVIAYAYGQQCPSGNPDIKDSDRQFMVGKHNEFRSTTAKGKAVNSDGRTLPTGKNIFKLSWDCTLEAEAQAVAESNAQNGCQMAHKKPNPFGENLATGYGKQDSSSYTSEVFPTSIKMWYGELAKPGYKNDVSKFVFTSGIGHWSAVVWGKVKRIGCGVAKCDSDNDFDTGAGILTKSIIACQYWPAPNLGSAPIYDKGTPCQKSSDCPTDSTCSASEGLCVDASAKSTTQLPSAESILAYEKPVIDFDDSAVTAVMSGYGQDGEGVVTYSTWNGCSQDGCSVPNGLAGTCRASDDKCVDAVWSKAGCWAC